MQQQLDMDVNRVGAAFGAEGHKQHYRHLEGVWGSLNRIMQGNPMWNSLLEWERKLPRTEKEQAVWDAKQAGGDGYEAHGFDGFEDHQLRPFWIGDPNYEISLSVQGELFLSELTGDGVQLRTGRLVPDPSQPGTMIVPEFMEHPQRDDILAHGCVGYSMDKGDYYLNNFVGTLVDGVKAISGNEPSRRGPSGPALRLKYEHGAISVFAATFYQPRVKKKIAECVEVAVPAGCGPGSTFQLNHNGRHVMVGCPLGTGPGSRIKLHALMAPGAPPPPPKPKPFSMWDVIDWIPG